MKAKEKIKEQQTQQFLFPGSPYEPMRYGAADNAIAHIPKKIKRYGDADVNNNRTYKTPKLTITIEGRNKDIPDSALRTLDFILLKHTKQNANGNSTVVEFSFDEYASYRGVKSNQARMRLRKQLQNDIDILYQISIRWHDPDKKDSIETRLISAKAIFESKQRIRVRLVEEYAKYGGRRYLMAFDPRLGKLDERNPHIYQIGRKLIEHCMIKKNQERGIHNRIGVTSLLKAVPDIPTFEEVRDTNRAYRRRILDPLENCLEALGEAGILHEWTWWKANNTPLTDEELAIANYDTLITCMVHYELIKPNEEDNEKQQEIAAA